MTKATKLELQEVCQPLLPCCRYLPMSVSSLLEQFESLMSPASKGVLTPEQQRGAAAHAAWVELQASSKRWG